MPRTFPDIVEVHTVAERRFDTSRGDQSATLQLKANGETDCLIEIDGVAVPSTTPAPQGWGSGIENVYHVYVVGETGAVRSFTIELGEGELPLRIEPDWHAEANPPSPEG